MRLIQDLRMCHTQTVQTKAATRICVALLLVSVMFVIGPIAAELIELKKSPPVTKKVDAFPRVVTGAAPAVISKINDSLARQDAEARRASDRDNVDWTRRVAVTMVGPKYLSMVAADGFDPSGNHAATISVAMVFDLSTGALVDWGALAPGLVQKISAKGAIPSSKLLSLYKEQAPDCAESLDDLEKEGPLHFIIWPDAQHGLVAEVADADLPEAARECGVARALPLEGLKSAGVSADLLGAISAAHK